MTIKEGLYLLPGLAGFFIAAYNMQDYRDLANKPKFTMGLTETANQDTVYVDSTAYMKKPSGTSGQYVKGNGQLETFPTIPAQYNPVSGANITITGSYPNQTISASSDSVQFFNRGGRMRRILKVFSDFIAYIP